MAEFDQRRFQKPQQLGDILKAVIRKEGIGKKALEGRRLARKILLDLLGAEMADQVDVLSVKTGVVTVEVDSSALFQELAGFKQQEMKDAFRAAGLKVREVRVRLSR